MKESDPENRFSTRVAKTTHPQQQKLTDIPGQFPLMIAQVNRKLTELLLAPDLPPGLYLVATPIGNLADISLRALATLSRVNAIYCEDTRHSRKLLSHYGIRQTLYPYHDHNAHIETPKLLARVKAGEAIALISDAGTPLISDPGYNLVKEAHKEEIYITSLPGASAVTTALSIAGLPTDSFQFAGFLPTKKQARLKKLANLKDQCQCTLVLYESPKRIHKTITDMLQVFENRHCVLAKELTKLHETLYSGSLQELDSEKETIIPKGEFVILIAPPQQHVILSDDIILKKLAQELEHSSLRDAVQKLSKNLNLSKKRVYTLGLSLKK